MLPVFFVERISGLRKGELAADSDLCPKNLHPPRSGEFAGAGAGGGEDGQFYDACHVSTGKAPEKRQIPFLQCFPLLSACGPRP